MTPTPHRSKTSRHRATTPDPTGRQATPTRGARLTPSTLPTSTNGASQAIGHRSNRGMSGLTSRGQPSPSGIDHRHTDQPHKQCKCTARAPREANPSGWPLLAVLPTSRPPRGDLLQDMRPSTTARQERGHRPHRPRRGGHYNRRSISVKEQ